MHSHVHDKLTVKSELVSASFNVALELSLEVNREMLLQLPFCDKLFLALVALVHFYVLVMSRSVLDQADVIRELCIAEFAVVPLHS